MVCYLQGGAQVEIRSGVIVAYLENSHAMWMLKRPSVLNFIQATMWFDCISNFVSIWKTLWIGGTWYLSLQSRPSLICKTLKYKNPLLQIMYLIEPNRPVKKSTKTVKKSIWGRLHRSLGFPSVYLFLELDQQFCILAAASFSYFIYLEDVFTWVRKVWWRSGNSWIL